MEKELTPEEIKILEQEEEYRAHQEQEAAASEHEAMCREQAEYEAQQESDRGYYEQQCGPDR